LKTLYNTGVRHTCIYVGGATRYGAVTVKSITVKEAAEALGISTRAVLLRREKGSLKGFMTTNARGSEEYRIYPTKEILEGLHKIGSPLVASPEAEAEFDVVDVSGKEVEGQNHSAPRATAMADRETEDAQDVEPLSDDAKSPTYGAGDTVPPSTSGPTDWTKAERAKAANGVAEDLWNNLISKFMTQIGEKDQLIGEMRSELQEKDRQLLLLPDSEAIAKRVEEEARKLSEAERQKAEEEAKRAEAEAQRAETEKKNNELAQLEVIALQKQVGLLQEKASSFAKLTELEAELPLLQGQLAQERLQKDEALAEATAKLTALEKAKEEAETAKAKLEESLQSEIARLREEKDEQAKSIESKFDALSQELKQLQKPQTSWWMKMLGSQ
jgi:hypothetical protein